MLQVDATFEDAESLQAVPRLVYALLRSPLLGPHPSGHPDTPTALRLLWSALPPEDLQTAVYPCLSSYQNPETQVSCCYPCMLAPSIAGKERYDNSRASDSRESIVLPLSMQWIQIFLGFSKVNSSPEGLILSRLRNCVSSTFMLSVLHL